MPWTFDKLHLQLYSIVEYILKKTYCDHPFKLKWKELQDPTIKYPLSENISWRSIKLLLDIEDLSQYRDFIVQCPSIENYIQLTNKAKNTVEFGILKPIMETNDNEHKEMGTTLIPSIDKTSEDKTIQDILHTVIPYLQEYSETHQDEYAYLCDEWITNGLHLECTMEELKNICQITSQDDLYMLLKLSLALQNYFTIDKIEGEIEITPNIEEASTTDASPPEYDNPHMTLVLTDLGCSSLHKHVFQIVTKSANTQKMNHLTMAWCLAVREGLSEQSTWTEAKHLLLSNTYVEYSCYLTACLPLGKIIKMYVDPDVYLLSYGLYHGNTNKQVIPTVSTQNTPITTNLQQGDPPATQTASIILLPTLLSPGTNILKIENSGCNRPSEQSWENIGDDKQEGWEPLHPTDNFGFINSMIYKTMEEWTANSKNKKHSFYGTYQHMKYKGYTHILPWENICQIMHVTILGQYVEFVTQCPAVSSNYHLLWDTRENYI